MLSFSYYSVSYNFLLKILVFFPKNDKKNFSDFSKVFCNIIHTFNLFIGQSFFLLAKFYSPFDLSFYLYICDYSLISICICHRIKLHTTYMLLQSYRLKQIPYINYLSRHQVSLVITNKLLFYYKLSYLLTFTILKFQLFLAANGTF